MDKPSGLTSARTVARVKHLLPNGTKIGHTGTLDPLASGLLVLLIGQATRLSRYVTGLNKTYTATASFGAVSDTLDAEGKITILKDALVPSEGALQGAARRFTGTVLQTPPMASAVKVGGVRLYNAHRRGENVERKSRIVTIHSLLLEALDPTEKTATFTVMCSSGTYIRALVADLAESLGTGAYLSALRRTSVGHLTLENASTFEQFASDTIQKHIIQKREVVTFLPAVNISPIERALVCNGSRLSAFGIEGSYRVEAGGELLAIYRDDEDVPLARPEVVLCAG
ncbi:MAG: tRNA pseudouridine(55) synthase TruB [Rubrobacter sp.]|nr:tRNA pseudouridine(55) synthase TruB [Rubrobacter sp.]